MAESTHVWEPVPPDARDILAIVGSRKFPESIAVLHAHQMILDVIARQRPDLIVSGGAPGIDTLAEQVAHMEGIPFIDFPPKNKRWEPEGYKERNQHIADVCTRLMSIRSHVSRSYGSGWTADEAERQGKLVWRVML